MSPTDYIPRTMSPEAIEMYPAGQQTSSTPAPPPAAASAKTSWHPKLTVYRLLVIAMTLGFSVSKAALSYQGRTIAPITLEWLFSTGVFLLFFALDTYQSRVNAPAFPWFFEVDLVHYFWAHICAIFGIRVTALYSTEDVNRRPSVIRGSQPPIRGYDMLVMFTTIVFGVIKSAMAYAGYNTGMTTVDWVGGAIVGVGMYWLGLYESSPVNKMPYLFSTDYSRDIKKYTQPPLLVAPQLALIAFSAWWSYLCSGWLVSLTRPFHMESTREPIFDKATITIVLPGFAISGISLILATICVAGFAIAVVLMSRFRAGLLSRNASFLWTRASPLIALLSFFSLLSFFLSLLILCIAFFPELATWDTKIISVTMMLVVTDLVWIAWLLAAIWYSGRVMSRYVRRVWGRVSPRVLGERRERRRSVGV